MNTKPNCGLFITGTDTGVGKTFVACCIVRELRATGKRIGVYKPAASGCERVDGTLVSEDAVALWEAAGRPKTLEAVCPQRFAAPLAPHLAAAAEGRRLDSKLMRTGLNAWRDDSDFVVVEGAGGLMSPLGDAEYVADLAYEFGYPLIVVAPNILGVINQTLQTLVAASAFRSGLKVAGIVLNDVKPYDFSNDPSMQSNRRELERHAKVPILATVRYLSEGFDRTAAWDLLGMVSDGR